MTDICHRSLRTIPDILHHHVTQRPDAPALLDTAGIALSYAALGQEIEALAAQINGHLPVASRTPRIGIVLPNGPDISVILLAATRCGTAVPFNPAQTEAEFCSQFTATGIDILLIEAGTDSPAMRAARDLSIPVLPLSAYRTLPAGNAATPRARLPEDIALILMTSGSTGKPKIVPLSHRNVCRSALDVGQSLGLAPTDRCLVMWEQFHIGGLVDLLLAPLATGGSIVTAGSFDAAGFFKLQALHQATWFQGVPTTLGAVLHHANAHAIQTPLPHLRLLRSVAAALSPDLLRRLTAQFQVPVVRTLGMTEAGPLITTTKPVLEEPKPQSVGQSAGPEICIFDPDGNPLPPNQAGEVAIRGENVFDGYLDNAEANAQSFQAGWFLTGDLGYLDAEGDLFLTGRAKDMINRGGEKINPGEVDAALMAHPDIEEAACFAVAHGTLGEDIAGAVTAKDGAQPDPQRIRQFLAQTLTRHKIPARIEVMPDLPRTPVGKIDRQALRSIFESAPALSPPDAAPQTPLEVLVADIWRRELSLTTLGIDDDFAAVDGDSLSAVRILVALEAALDAPVPHEVIEDFATVRGIAAGLAHHGLAVPDTPRSDTYHTAQTAEVLNEDHVFSGDTDAAQQLISSASGLSDLKLKMDYLLTHLTPADALAVIDALEGTRPGTGPEPAGVLARKRMQWDLAARAEMVRSHLRAAPKARHWHREVLFPGALMYGDPSVPAAQKSLIVGFGGNRQRLLMATYRVLADLDPAQTDLLLLMDPSKRCFIAGAPGMGAGFAAMARTVTQICTDRGYRRLVGLGTSAGTFAALHAGLVEGFDAVAVVSPAGFSRHADWAEVIASIAPQHDPDRMPIRIIYGRRPRHKADADSIRPYLPDAEYIRYEEAGKNILPDAQERGTLNRLLGDWLA